MSDFMMEREIQEALTAGENALQSLYAASEQLDSARNQTRRVRGFRLDVNDLSHIIVRDRCA